jgi:peptidoglycan L-alanyl-D-glutamate endopeptidase CwlK
MSVDFKRIEIGQLDLEFYSDTFNLLNDLPDTWIVTEGRRSMQRSNDLYVLYKLSTGPRAAPGGLSPHNYGLAIDVALDGEPEKKGLQLVWNIKHPAWQRLVSAIWKHPRLRSGKWYSDWPHIEKLNWKDYVAWRKNYEDNALYLTGKYPTITMPKFV